MITNPYDTYLHGTHDIGAEALHEGRAGWVLSTEEVGLNLNVKGVNYGNLADQGFNVIARLNYSHHGEGTIPFPHEYGLFAQVCAAFVARSKGCRIWVIGNEPNHENERKGGIPIEPEQYAACFARCRAEIKRVHSDHLVLTAACAPYHASPIPWDEYLDRMLQEARRLGGFDGVTIHAYTRWDDPAMIASEIKMDASTPLGGTYAGFLTYQDAIYCEPGNVPIPLRVITEFDKLDGWPQGGSQIYTAALQNIDQHNAAQPDTPIHGLIAYRWASHDLWSYQTNAGVQADIRNAARLGIKPPAMGTPGDSTLLIPKVSTGNPQEPPTPAPDALPPREWDPRLDARGVKVETPALQPGQQFWRADRVIWLDVQQSQGRYHILGSVWRQGQKVAGVPLKVMWEDGRKDAPIKTEDKSRDHPPFNYWYNYPMSPSLHEFSIRVDDGIPSETVKGIGMGFNGNPNEHTSTVVEWELETWPESQTAPTEPGTVPEPGTPSTVPALAHPVSDLRYRNVTQRYGRGVNKAYYSQFKVDGVPLEGHNGIDFGTPIGTEIVAVDDGVVIEQANDITGYGVYVKMKHSWGESLYAHLDPSIIPAGVGARVRKGNWLGDSGNSGRSTGPHLHFGMRVNPYNRQDGMGGYADPAKYLSNAGTPTPPPAPTEPPTGDIAQAIKAAAAEFGVDPGLLLSQAMAESSLNPRAISPAGAKGLLQIMDPTWAEWSPKINAGNDPFDPAQNARVGAAYLRWCLSQVDGDRIKALVAYNWGLGNLLSGRESPLPTRIYAYSVAHGADLIKALGS